MTDFDREDVRHDKKVRLIILGVLAVAIVLAQLDLMGYFGQW